MDNFGRAITEPIPDANAAGSGYDVLVLYYQRKRSVVLSITHIVDLQGGTEGDVA